MSPDRRSVTSAINGRVSKGPVTAEGKQRSSRNAVRHGLLATCLVIESESLSAFQDAHDTHIKRFQPADEAELAVVEEITSSYWRLRRAWAIETRMLDNAASDASAHPLDRMTSAFCSVADSKALALMNRYQARLETLSARALRKLKVLRSDFPIPPDDAIPSCPPSLRDLPDPLPAAGEDKFPDAELPTEPTPDPSETVELPNEPNSDEKQTTSPHSDLLEPLHFPPSPPAAVVRPLLDPAIEPLFANRVRPRATPTPPSPKTHELPNEPTSDGKQATTTLPEPQRFYLIAKLHQSTDP